MELQPYQVEFFFKDDSGIVLSSKVDFIFAEDYDSALEQAEEMQEEMGAQDFCLGD